MTMADEQIASQKGYDQYDSKKLTYHIGILTALSANYNTINML